MVEKKNNGVSKWVIGLLVSVGIVAIGGVGHLAMTANSTATAAAITAKEAAAASKATEKQIDSLHEDVREIRRIVLRIEKNGRGK